MRMQRLRVAGRVCLLLVWPLLGLSPTSQAEERLELSPDRVIQLAREHSLELRQAEILQQKADVEVRSARRPAHSPELLVRGGPREGTPSPDLELGLSWTLEPPGQRSARTRAARADQDAQTSTLAQLRQERIARALTTYYECLQARSVLQGTLQQKEQDDALHQLTQLRVEQGDAAPLELKLIEAERLQNQATLVRATANLERHLQQLRLEVGASSTTQLTLSSEAPSLPTLDTMTPLADILARRADVQALQKQVNAAEARLVAQKRAAVPAVTLEASVAREEDRNIALAGVSFPLPIFGQNDFRQDSGEVAMARAEVQQARLDLEQTYRQAEAEYQAVLAEATAALRAAHMLSEADALHQEALRLFVSAYQKGDRSLLDVLAVRREAHAATQSALQGKHDAALLAIKLQFLAGGWQ